MLLLLPLDGVPVHGARNPAQKALLALFFSTVLPEAEYVYE